MQRLTEVGSIQIYRYRKKHGRREIDTNVCDRNSYREGKGNTKTETYIQTNRQATEC